MRLTAVVLLTCLCLPVFAQPARAQGQDPAARIEAQRKAMQALAFLDGQWRGRFVMTGPDGNARTFTHTERIGLLLDGSLRLIEGTSYGADGKAQFNALGVVSFDPDTKAYTMRSYAQGHAVDAPLRVRADGFAWELPMGPGARLRYVATLHDGHWQETGECVVDGQPPVKIMELSLQRIGASAWPAAGAVPTR